MVRVSEEDDEDGVFFYLYFLYCKIFIFFWILLGGRFNETLTFRHQNFTKL